MAQAVLAAAAASWGVLMGVAPILQIRRMLRERSSRDVSLGYFMILLIGFLLWISYGVAAGTALRTATALPVSRGRLRRLAGTLRRRQRRPGAVSAARSVGQRPGLLPAVHLPGVPGTGQIHHRGVFVDPDHRGARGRVQHRTSQ